MIRQNLIPEKDYGVLCRDVFVTKIQEVAEEVKRNGYAVLEVGTLESDLEQLSNVFDSVYRRYVKTWGEQRLDCLNELYTVRLPIQYDADVFLKLALNDSLLALVGELIKGKFILNQQNAIINPPQKDYNQGAWHRDLPYQHFVTDRPIAINALLCVDDFTIDNGGTFVIPGSHKTPSFPTANFIKKNAIQVTAPAGSYIVLDCMTYHSGGRNCSNLGRRAVNHVFTIPFFKQQIKIPGSFNSSSLSEFDKEVLGFGFQEPSSVEAYLDNVQHKQKSRKA